MLREQVNASAYNFQSVTLLFKEVDDSIKTLQVFYSEEEKEHKESEAKVGWQADLVAPGTYCFSDIITIALLYNRTMISKIYDKHMQ